MKTILTTTGKRKLQDELQFLSTTEKARIINELAEAKDRGGVSENSEYETAKEEYERLQKRIIKIGEMINNSTIVSSFDISTDKVSVLSTVKVLNKGKELKFTIVPENEIDVKSGKISLNSPIGTGLIGKKVGEVASIETPGGVLELQILEITA